MKMDTTASPWRYDVAAARAIRADNQRRTAILRYASWAAVFPISRMVRLHFSCGHFDQAPVGGDSVPRQRRLEPCGRHPSRRGEYAAPHLGEGRPSEPDPAILAS